MRAEILWTLRQLWKPHRECRTYRRIIAAALVFALVYAQSPFPEMVNVGFGAAYAMGFFYGTTGIMDVGRARRKRLGFLRAIGRKNLRVFPERFWGTYYQGEQFGVVRAWTAGVARELGLMNAREGSKPNARYEEISVRRSTP